MDKYLPNYVRKKEAFELLKNNGNSIRCIRRTINDVIREKRRLNKDAPFYGKMISEWEWHEIIGLLGMPKGYKWREYI
jgi:hypothetical protein